MSRAYQKKNGEANPIFGGVKNALLIKYNNLVSGLHSNNVQGAIDEINTNLVANNQQFKFGYDSTSEKYGYILKEADTDVFVPFNSLEYLIKDGIVQNGYVFESKPLRLSDWGGSAHAPTITQGDNYIRVLNTTANNHQGSYIATTPINLSNKKYLVLDFKYNSNSDGTNLQVALALSDKNTDKLNENIYGKAYSKDAIQPNRRTLLLSLENLTVANLYIAISCAMISVDVYNLFVI